MNKSIFNKYTLVWVLTGFTVVFLIHQMYGDARIINYSGIVQGCTQRLVKEELRDIQDDELITYINDIIYNLQTGKGDYNLVKFNDAQFHKKLDVLDATWEEIKLYIHKYRLDENCYDQLYDLSELHFQQAEDLVSRAEQQSSRKLLYFMYVYFLSVIVCTVAFFLWKNLNVKSVSETMKKDYLTGALTPRAFTEEAMEIYQKRNEEQYVMVAFDIKKFTKLNIIYGHEAGNAFLCNVADALIEHNILGTRITSDDFYAMIEWQEDVVAVLNKWIWESLKNSEIKDTSIIEEMIFRYGVVIVQDENEPIKSAMEKAQMAHQVAKHEGKTIVWCDEELVERLAKEACCEEHLVEGIENKEFHVYLQPQIDLSTNEIIGAESLVRWKLNAENLLFPDEFIPLFERKGFIKYLDYYMLEEVCRYLSDQKALHKELFVISVNFSRVTLADNDFCLKIMNIVNKYEIPYHYICIEIVETALNSMEKQTINLLNELKDLGFKIAMDDFGAGYSSLSVLSNLPVHILKIDKEFLWSIDQNEKMRHIISMIVKMAHKIGLQTMCEGVETKEQVDFLKSIDCDLAQGYFYSCPIPKESFAEKF